MLGIQRARGQWRAVALALVAALIALTQTGCAFLGASPSDHVREVRIQGQITGESIQSRLAGGTTTQAIQATVTCNSLSSRAAADGTFSLDLLAAREYDCLVSDEPTYNPVNVVLSGAAGDTLSLNFGSGSDSTCGALASAHLECPALRLRTGTIAGKVIVAGGTAPIANAAVRCADTHGNEVTPNWSSGQTDATGAFSVAGLPVGTYGCVATTPAGQSGFGRARVLPSVSATLTLAACRVGCSPVTYHDGPVMRNYRAYLIFWQPSGYALDPSGGDSTYRSLLARYFRDVGGTPFFGLLAQYQDVAGPVANASTLAGTYTDTTPYRHCPAGPTSCARAAASVADPLYDSDIQAEVARIIQATHWTPSLETEFFVFLGDGAQSCQSQSPSSSCSFVKGGYALCGWHSAFTASSAQPVIYAAMINAGTTANICVNGNHGIGAATPTPPNGDWIADAEISWVSHEQFESISDPMLRTWYQSPPPPQGGEIADKCQGVFGAIHPNGANVTLAHGDTYILQSEWSGSANGCALG